MTNEANDHQKTLAKKLLDLQDAYSQVTHLDTFSAEDRTNYQDDLAKQYADALVRFQSTTNGGNASIR